MNRSRPSSRSLAAIVAVLAVAAAAGVHAQRIEANLLMRNYSGFLSGPGQKGKRIKGRQY